MAGRKARAVDLSRYPAHGSFQTLLNWHLAWGTRPGCDTSRRNRKWIKATFATLVHEEGLDPEYAARGLRFWTNEGVLPDQNDEDKLARIFRELFGDDPNLADWKADLQRALERDRAAKPKGGAPAKPLVPAVRVPRPTSHFVGRDDEVDYLAATLAAGSDLAVLLQGGPGIGKTELTKAIANDSRVVERFGERRWFIPLEAATTGSVMRDAIIRTLGSAQENGLKPALDALGKDASLLVLDNLETPWEIVGERQGVEAILAELASAPSLSLLGSFRGRDRPKKPNWRSHFVGPLDVAAAKKAFADIAGPWVLDDARLDDFIEVLAGVPLAIQLLAHRAAGRTSLAPLWREWQERGVDILNLPDEPVGPLSSFSQSILLSLNSNRTTPDARRLFAMLGQLPTSILDEHISAVLGDGALDAVDSLLRVGLVVEREGRIALLPPVKDLAFRKCTLSDEDRTLLRGHYLGVIAKLGLATTILVDDRNIGRIEVEFPNIEWAFLDIQYSSLIQETTIDAFRGLSRFIEFSSYPVRIFTYIDDKKPTTDSDIVFWAYRNVVAGDLMLRDGKIAFAEQAYGMALNFSEASAHAATQAEILIKYASANLERGWYSESLKSIDKIYSLYKEIDDPDFGETSTDFRLLRGRKSLELKEFDAAYDDFFWSTVYAGGDKLAQAKGLVGAGEARLAQGIFHVAHDVFEMALAIFRPMSCSRWEARCLASLGRLDLREENFDAAQAKLEEALSIFRQIGHGPGEADAKRGLEEVEQSRATVTAPPPTAG